MMHIARDLSGGEKQRVVLARQLAKEPVMLFADEPTGTLDPGTAKIVHAMLIEAAKTNNMGIVVTSHFSQVIEDVANRAILLVDGSIAKIGTPKEVIAEFMKGYDDTEKFEEAELGENIVIARDLVKRYISVDRGWSRQSTASRSKSRPRRSSGSSARAGQERPRSPVSWQA